MSVTSMLYYAILYYTIQCTILYYTILYYTLYYNIIDAEGAGWLPRGTPGAASPRHREREREREREHDVCVCVFLMHVVNVRIHNACCERKEGR